jgi:glutathione S-transferase
MVNITSEVQNAEVKSWRGVHLLHFWFSSCSQKVRIVLAEKGISFVSHHIDLVTCENATQWFLSINKRGLVPILVSSKTYQAPMINRSTFGSQVHDGQVHVESNEIMEYIEKTWPEPKMSVDDPFTRSTLLVEDALHVDMRTLTFGFLLPRAIAAKPMKRLQDYANLGPQDDGRDSEVQISLHNAVCRCLCPSPRTNTRDKRAQMIDV